MIVTCARCGEDFDDADRVTICPHPLIMPAEDLARKKLALELPSQVCFAHMPTGPAYRVACIHWNGMVELDGMAGAFAPHLFVAPTGEAG